MSSQKSIMYAGLLSVLIGVSACSDPFHKTSTLGAHKVLSLDAKQRVVVSGYREKEDNISHAYAKGDHATADSYEKQAVVCAEPSPDALVAQASYIASRLNNRNGSGGSLAAGSGETAANIGLRTQTIQLLRDGYYRVCEAYLNGAIGKTEYELIVQGVDEFMVVLVAIEALGGVTKAPNFVIAASGEAKVNENGIVSAQAQANSASVITADQLNKIISALNVERKNPSTEQMSAIKNIVTSYLNLKKHQFNKILRMRKHR